MPKALTLLNSNITYFFLTNLVHKVQVLSPVKNKINLFWRLDVEKSSTAQKMKISIKDFFSKFDQIHSFLWIWSYLLKKSLMENL